MSSRQIRITPEFHEQPDIKKLARTLIALATRIMEQKQAAEQALAGSEEEGPMT